MQKFLIGTCLLFMLVSGFALYAQNPCPDGLPPNTTCYSGVDENNAYYLIAIPENYKNRLILWNHGYTLDPPGPLTRAEDLGFPGYLLPEGYAVAASSYRPNPIGRGGWAVADAVQDTENLRQRFIDQFGRPALTFVVGASEGGIITAAIAELFGSDGEGSLNYDGSLPLCGPLAGGRRNWYGAFDLRVVYQYYCSNLPRPDEPEYPLYFGLAPDNMLTPDDVVGRINECTGILLPPEQRTPEQGERLANILNVTRVPSGFLITDMTFATFGLQELVLVRTQGKSPVTNLGVKYSGSNDDEALNSGVFRAGSDPEAVAYIVNAYDPTGDISMPTVTLHTIGDGLVIVENERAYQETLEKAETLDKLFQAYTDADGHCDFSISEFQAIFHSLLQWVETGDAPSIKHAKDACEYYREIYGDSCRFNPTFKPDRLETRILPRKP